MNPVSSFLDEAASGGPECGDASGLQPTHVGPRYPMAELHWLPVTAHIQFKAPLLTYRVAAGFAFLIWTILLEST